SEALPDQQKARLCQAVVATVLLYNDETWTLTATLERQLDSTHSGPLRAPFRADESVGTEALYDRAKLQRPSIILHRVRSGGVRPEPIDTWTGCCATRGHPTLPTGWTSSALRLSGAPSDAPCSVTLARGDGYFVVVGSGGQGQVTAFNITHHTHSKRFDGKCSCALHPRSSKPGPLSPELKLQFPVTPLAKVFAQIVSPLCPPPTDVICLCNCARGCTKKPPIESPPRGSSCHLINNSELRLKLRSPGATQKTVVAQAATGALGESVAAPSSHSDFQFPCFSRLTPAGQGEAVGSNSSNRKQFRHWLAAFPLRPEPQNCADLPATEMFLFIRDNHCRFDEFNLTRLLHDDDYQDLERRMLACICPISLLALCANALSLFVFLRQRWDNRAIRLVLVSVSVWEVMLQSAILLEAVLVFSGVKHSHSPASYAITSLLQVCINAATAVRNWNMVVLSLSRCELVWYPIPSRGQQLIFTMRRLKLLLGLIVAAGLVLGCLARLEYIGVVCENISDPEMGSVVMRPLLSGVQLHQPPPPSPSAPPAVLSGDSNLSGGNFSQQSLLLEAATAEPIGAPGLPSIAFYTFQSLLPPLIIPFPTVLMLLKLRRARQVTRILQLSRSSNFQLPGSRADLRLLMRRGTSEQQPQQPARSHSLRSQQQQPTERLSSSQSSSYAAQQYRTSVLVLALVLIFCLLESPTFLSTLSHYLLPKLDLLGHNTIFIVNILTVMDSLLNFFVYAAASSTFRQPLGQTLFKPPTPVPPPKETKKALLCRPSPPPAHFILRTPKNSTVTPPNMAGLQFKADMLGQQRRQQRSGAISLPAASSQTRFQRFIRRFYAAPGSLIGQVRRKSMAVLSPQTAAAAAAAAAATTTSATSPNSTAAGAGDTCGSQADLASMMLMKRPQPASLQSLLRKTRFTSVELKVIYRRFKTECPYGVMHEEILEHILAQIFPLGNAHLFSHFVFCCFDVNRTGSVNFEQFVLCLNILLKGSREERLRWIFNMYDINRDGEINRRELQELVGAVFELLGARVRPAVSPGDIERHTGEVFCRLDTDGDGMFSDIAESSLGPLPARMPRVVKVDAAEVGGPVFGGAAAPAAAAPAAATPAASRSHRLLRLLTATGRLKKRRALDKVGEAEDGGVARQRPVSSSSSSGSRCSGGCRLYSAPSAGEGMADDGIVAGLAALAFVAVVQGVLQRICRTVGRIVTSRRSPRQRLDKLNRRRRRRLRRPFESRDAVRHAQQLQIEVPRVLLAGAVLVVGDDVLPGVLVRLQQRLAHMAPAAPPDQQGQQDDQHQDAQHHGDDDAGSGDGEHRDIADLAAGAREAGEAAAGEGQAATGYAVAAVLARTHRSPRMVQSGRQPHTVLPLGCRVPRHTWFCGQVAPAGQAPTLGSLHRLTRDKAERRNSSAAGLLTAESAGRRAELTSGPARQEDCRSSCGGCTVTWKDGRAGQSNCSSGGSSRIHRNRRAADDALAQLDIIITIDKAAPQCCIVDAFARVQHHLHHELETAADSNCVQTAVGHVRVGQDGLAQHVVAGVQLGHQAAVPQAERQLCRSVGVGALSFEQHPTGLPAAELHRQTGGLLWGACGLLAPSCKVGAGTSQAPLVLLRTQPDLQSHWWGAEAPMAPQQNPFGPQREAEHDASTRAESQTAPECVDRLSATRSISWLPTRSWASWATTPCLGKPSPVSSPKPAGVASARQLLASDGAVPPLPWATGDGQIDGPGAEVDASSQLAGDQVYAEKVGLAGRRAGWLPVGPGVQQDAVRAAGQEAEAQLSVNACGTQVPLFRQAPGAHWTGAEADDDADGSELQAPQTAALDRLMPTRPLLLVRMAGGGQVDPFTDRRWLQPPGQPNNRRQGLQLVASSATDNCSPQAGQGGPHGEVHFSPGVERRPGGYKESQGGFAAGQPGGIGHADRQDLVRQGAQLGGQRQSNWLHGLFNKICSHRSGRVKSLLRHGVDANQLGGGGRARCLGDRHRQGVVRRPGARLQRDSFRRVGQGEKLVKRVGVLPAVGAPIPGDVIVGLDAGRAEVQLMGGCEMAAESKNSTTSVVDDREVGPAAGTTVTVTVAVTTGPPVGSVMLMGSKQAEESPPSGHTPSEVEPGPGLSSADRLVKAELAAFLSGSVANIWLGSSTVPEGAESSTADGGRARAATAVQGQYGVGVHSIVRVGRLVSTESASVTLKVVTSVSAAAFSNRLAETVAGFITGLLSLASVTRIRVGNNQGAAVNVGHVGHAEISGTAGGQRALQPAGVGHVRVLSEGHHGRVVDADSLGHGQSGRLAGHKRGRSVRRVLNMNCDSACEFTVRRQTDVLRRLLAACGGRQQVVGQRVQVRIVGFDGGEHRSWPGKKLILFTDPEKLSIPVEGLISNRGVLPGVLADIGDGQQVRAAESRPEIDNIGQADRDGGRGAENSVKRHVDQAVAVGHLVVVQRPGYVDFSGGKFNAKRVAGVAAHDLVLDDGVQVRVRGRHLRRGMPPTVNELALNTGGLSLMSDNEMRMFSVALLGLGRMPASTEAARSVASTGRLRASRSNTRPDRVNSSPVLASMSNMTASLTDANEQTGSHRVVVERGHPTDELPGGRCLVKSLGKDGILNGVGGEEQRRPVVRIADGDVQSHVGVNLANFVRFYVGSTAQVQQKVGRDVVLVAAVGAHEDALVALRGHVVVGKAEVLPARGIGDGPRAEHETPAELCRHGQGRQAGRHVQNSWALTKNRRQQVLVAGQEHTDNNSGPSDAACCQGNRIEGFHYELHQCRIPVIHHGIVASVGVVGEHPDDLGAGGYIVHDHPGVVDAVELGRVVIDVGQDDLKCAQRAEARRACNESKHFGMSFLTRLYTTRPLLPVSASVATRSTVDTGLPGGRPSRKLTGEVGQARKTGAFKFASLMVIDRLATALLSLAPTAGQPPGQVPLSTAMTGTVEWKRGHLGASVIKVIADIGVITILGLQLVHYAINWHSLRYGGLAVADYRRFIVSISNGNDNAGSLPGNRAQPVSNGDAEFVLPRSRVQRFIVHFPDSLKHFDERILSSRVGLNVEERALRSVLRRSQSQDARVAGQGERQAGKVRRGQPNRGPDVVEAGAANHSSLLPGQGGLREACTSANLNLHSEQKARKATNLNGQPVGLAGSERLVANGNQVAQVGHNPEATLGQSLRARRQRERQTGIRVGIGADKFRHDAGRSHSGAGLCSGLLVERRPENQRQAAIERALDNRHLVVGWLNIDSEWNEKNANPS
uniref:EF-hand domain-containing protein n=1 Tax=Macrostomum lignano TaxID=282301 RepID=A0A1I8GXA6_9PLAT